MAQFNRPCREEERKGERGREGKRHLSLHCVMRSEVDHLRLEGFIVAEASFGGKYLTICPPTSAHTLTHTHTHTHTHTLRTQKRIHQHTLTHTYGQLWVFKRAALTTRRGGCKSSLNGKWCRNVCTCVRVCVCM